MNSNTLDMQVYLAKGPDPRPPALLLLHSATGHSDMFKAECDGLSALGISCFSLEAPYSGWRNPSRRPGIVDPECELALWEQTANELSQMYSLAVDKYNCDPNRVGFFGLNLGGSVGAFWLRQHGKVKSAIFSGCIPKLSWFWAQSSDVRALRIRQRTDIKPDLFVQTFKGLDLTESLPLLKTENILVQFGLQDDWIDQEQRQRFSKRFGNCLAISEIDDGHDMKSVMAMEQRKSFLWRTLRSRQHIIQELIF